MAGAFFFICMFMITVGGLLLFRPIQVHSITDYSEPAALEERKKVTLKMAEYLEKNPQIVKQERFQELPREAPAAPNATSPKTAPPETTTPASTPIPHQFSISFQGSNMQFETMEDFNHWLYSNAMQEPIGFLNQLQDDANPELYLDTLKKVTEMNPSDPVAEQVKEKYLAAAKNLIQNKDGYHQQMMQKALQSYLDLEKDKELGKKTADEILKNQ